MKKARTSGHEYKTINNKIKKQFGKAIFTQRVARMPIVLSVLLELTIKSQECLIVTLPGLDGISLAVAIEAH